jgi:uncharacterized protein with HEPN domain
MARRDLGLLLGDVLDGCEALSRYLEGVSLSRYFDDEILRMAVERRLEIIGEALGQALGVDPGIVSEVPEAPRVVALRNRLAHAYSAIDDETLFIVATESVPALAAKIASLARERGLLQ